MTTVPEAYTSRPPALVHEGWREAFAWLVQGTTVRRADDGADFDLALFGPTSRGVARKRWERLRHETDMRRVVHARQVHGGRVRCHGGGPEGLALVKECDAHVTDRPGVLLGVTVADCIPVSIVDPVRRAVALAHAGWRGVAAGVVEGALATLGERHGTRAGDVHVHLGPAICGSCYEVGPEVFEAVGRPAPPGPRPIDLRAVVAQRVVAAGVGPGRVTISGHCTRCTGSPLFSHRGGDAGRQVAFLGIREAAPPAP